MPSSSHSGSAALRILPGACRLPIELVQEIFYLLSPFDFDSARRTCRTWFFASLDKRLLGSQLDQGGWQAGAEQDIHEAAGYYARKQSVDSRAGYYQASSSAACQSMNCEWIWSKRLAAEVRLRPEWSGGDTRGSFLSVQGSSGTLPVHVIKPPTFKSPNIRGAVSLVSPTIFAVSGCNRFVLCVQDRVVFIYTLQSFKSGTRPLTSILCHRRIVKVSMNTSCGRYAVAMLLEGRVGMCCEVGISPCSRPADGRINASMGLRDFRNFDVHTTFRSRNHISQQDQREPNVPLTRRRQTSPEVAAHRRGGHRYGSVGKTEFIREGALKLTDGELYHGSGEMPNPLVPNALFNQFFPVSPINDSAKGPPPMGGPSRAHPFKNVDPLTGTSVAIELGQRQIYKNICGVHDPPKSVAICAQRQCVAFGCKTGVELRWVDAQKGSALSRWFPLAAPSDYLFFVPPRDGELTTSDTKLRLISSAAGPAEFVDADHYRAIPLSDGHILFTDPGSGHLYLGSDKPGGPTKLRREVLCLPPAGHPHGKQPDCYAAGHEMRWGVRIVVAYGRTVMLYCVPPDHFERARPTTPGFQVAQSDLAMDIAVDGSHGEPHRLEGVQIHALGGGTLQDVAVDSRSGGLKVWLFLQGEDSSRTKEKPRARFAWSSSVNLSIPHP